MNANTDNKSVVLVKAEKSAFADLEKRIADLEKQLDTEGRVTRIEDRFTQAKDKASWTGDTKDEKSPSLMKRIANMEKELDAEARVTTMEERLKEGKNKSNWTMMNIFRSSMLSVHILLGMLFVLGFVFELFEGGWNINSVKDGDEWDNGMITTTTISTLVFSVISAFVIFFFKLTWGRVRDNAKSLDLANGRIDKYSAEMKQRFATFYGEMNSRLARVHERLDLLPSESEARVIRVHNRLDEVLLALAKHERLDQALESKAKKE